VTVARVEEAPDVASFDAAIVGAPVHMGHFSRPSWRTPRRRRIDLRRMPSGFFSISLTAAQDGGASREAPSIATCAASRPTPTGART
jgi:menaquinone-dependent protoporphyrinogen IX oxidase